MLRVYLLDRGMKVKERENKVLENEIQERIEYNRSNRYRKQVEKIMRDLNNLDDEVINEEMLKVFKSAVKELEKKTKANS